jgi:hypothetical protein
MPVDLTAQPLPAYGRPGSVVECYATIDQPTYWVVVENQSEHGKHFEMWRGSCELDDGGRPNIPSPCLPTRLVRRFANNSSMIRSYIAESLESGWCAPMSDVSSVQPPCPAPTPTLDEVLMRKTEVLVQAIQGTLDALAALVGPDAAARNTRAAVENALKQVLSAKPPAPVAAPVVAPRGPLVRGPKPGGRQLKVHVGPRAFAAMTNAAKDGARAAISGVGKGWGKLSKAAKDRVLAPHLAR